MPPIGGPICPGPIIPGPINPGPMNIGAGGGGCPQPKQGPSPMTWNFLRMYSFVNLQLCDFQND